MTNHVGPRPGIDAPGNVAPAAITAEQPRLAGAGPTLIVGIKMEIILEITVKARFDADHLIIRIGRQPACPVRLFFPSLKEKTRAQGFQAIDLIPVNGCRRVAVAEDAVPGPHAHP